MQLLPTSGASVYFNVPNIHLVFSDIFSSDLLVQQVLVSEHKLGTCYIRDRDRAEVLCNSALRLMGHSLPACTEFLDPVHHPEF
jgi:hypothetical protein